MRSHRCPAARSRVRRRRLVCLRPRVLKALAAILLVGFAAAIARASPEEPTASTDAASPAPLTFGITPVFLVGQSHFLEGFGAWLSERIQRPVHFVRRKSYAEITDMLLGGTLDAAWLCSFSYVFNRSTLPILAVPVFRGEPYYESYLIVSADDQTTQGYADLGGKVFAYVEPRSNTGYLYPRFAVQALGEDPNRFFRETFFTWSHTDLVHAVADQLAEAGGVDSYIWETLRLSDPALTARTRVVSGSTRFGFPPIVAGALLDEPEQRQLARVLWSMHLDPEGRELLGRLHLDRFQKATANLYDSIPPMIQSMKPSTE